MARFSEGERVRLNRSYSGEEKGRIGTVNEIYGNLYRVDYRDALGRMTFRYVTEEEIHRVAVAKPVKKNVQEIEEDDDLYESICDLVDVDISGEPMDYWREQGY